jgi:hypothetical protein
MLFQAFLNYYYQLFESNRGALGTLYQDQSMLTFEGQKLQGGQAIAQKLGSLPFGACKVAITSKDFQPSVSGGIMVFVTGNLLVSNILRHGSSLMEQLAVMGNWLRRWGS